MITIYSIGWPKVIQEGWNIRITTGVGGANRYSKKDRNVKKNEAKGIELKVFEEQYGFTYFVYSDSI